jgi:hypothetical protein
MKMKITQGKANSVKNKFEFENLCQGKKDVGLSGVQKGNFGFFY